MTHQGLRVAIDVGGTFTDIVVVDPDSHLHTYKVLNEPRAIGVKINQCIDDVMARGLSSEKVAVSALIHGTTVCSNTVLEGLGSATALICTRGFRDLLEVGGARRGANSDLNWSPLQPIVPRRLRLEVSERVLATGAIDTPLDEGELDEAIAVLRGHEVKAVAVAFMHAYANPTHERRVGEILRAALPGVAICLSHEVSGELGEYPRTSTTVLNAYLMDTVQGYLDGIEADLAEHHTPLMVMQTNAAMMASSHARRFPVRMLESGPAAGVLAATRIARQLDIDHAVAFDMGGTTAKACLIEHGEAALTQESEVGAGMNAGHGRGGGHKVRVPGFDVVEIGAGGGSIARIADGGALLVGPRSAGANPGPVCYGKGGTKPTVTDANVVLGYMNPQAIAGGSVAIDLAAARAAIEQDLARPLGLSIEEAAYGVHRVANATMARAVRSVTSERGRDPRVHTLIVSGGAGPIHAAALAQEVGIRKVVVPLFPGLFSAIGLQFAIQSYDRGRSVFFPLDEGSVERMRAVADEVRQELRDSISDLDLGGPATFHAYVDLRQALELTLPLPAADDPAPARTLVERFHAMHEASYGYSRQAEPITVVGVRVIANAEQGASTPQDILERGFSEHAGKDQEAKGLTRAAYFGPGFGMMAAQLLRRSDLAGAQVNGPAIIEEFDTTIVVPSGWTAASDAIGSIVLNFVGA